ncbi:hypothetical protein EJB05_23415, partial [Eragrostis curvula]
MAASNPAQYARLEVQLNQPVRVPSVDLRMCCLLVMQLEVQRCDECRQVLPPDYQPPLDEPWTTGIFGCAEDPESSTRPLILSPFPRSDPCTLFEF